MNDEILFLRLLLAPGIGLRSAKLLLEEAVDITSLFNSKVDLHSLPLSSKQINGLLSSENEDKAQEIALSCKQKNIQIITPNDNSFPESLSHLADPPLVLFVKGLWPLPQKRIGIVGTRRSTIAGFNFCQKFAFDLSNHGVCVTSGLARGIDTAAHRGCLQGPSQTVAIIGSGIDCIYPSENAKLANQISERGVIISEYPPGTQPLPHHFPVRNRLIAALSDALLVAEAPVKSGALITVNLALELGKEIFVFPSNPALYQGKGSVKLIKEGASCVTEISEITEAMGWETDNEKTSLTSPVLAENQKLILNSLDTLSQCANVDELASQSGMHVHHLLSDLAQLEEMGLVKSNAGNNWSVA